MDRLDTRPTTVGGGAGFPFRRRPLKRKSPAVSRTRVPRAHGAPRYRPCVQSVQAMFFPARAGVGAGKLVL